MTPKEKAEELAYQFAQIIPPSSYVAYEGGVQINFDLENSKICALIAVEAILFSNNTIFETNIPHECWKYWIEVKQELYKL